MVVELRVDPRGGRLAAREWRYDNHRHATTQFISALPSIRSVIHVVGGDDARRGTVSKKNLPLVAA